MNLEPVRRARLARARAQAESIRARGEAEADARRAAARAEAESALLEAAVAGEAEVRPEVEAIRAGAARRSQELLLEARREAYEQLRQAAVAAALALRTEPGYPQLLRALEARARSQLGPGAAVLPAPEGGLVAVAGRRRVDYSLGALAQLSLERIGAEPEELWR